MVNFEKGKKTQASVHTSPAFLQLQAFVLNFFLHLQCNNSTTVSGTAL